MAAKAKIEAVTRTPTEARVSAGQAATRKEWMEVPKPESKRMMASAREPSM